MTGFNQFAGAVPLSQPQPAGEPAGHPLAPVWNELREMKEILGGGVALFERFVASFTDAEPLPHVPAVAPLQDGSWGVFCLACTKAEGSYVYPCHHQDDPSATVPPARLVAAPEFIESPPEGAT